MARPTATANLRKASASVYIIDLAGELTSAAEGAVLNAYEQASGNQREFEIGESDAPESLPGSGTEVERRFFLSAVDFLEASKKFGGGDGEECGAMPEEDADEAELKAGKDR